MPSRRRRDYAVGYGKPPRRTRFKKGQSGNPKGRPKGAKNAATILNETLNERVIITENGRRKAITKKEALFKQLVNKAVSGDPRHTRMLLEAMDAVESQTDQAHGQESGFKEADQEVINQLLSRLQRMKPGGRNG
jgi:hypothetical protein